MTNGTTGIALSMLGSIYGYKVVIVMPASVRAERRNMIRAFGAELRLIERLTGIAAAVREAARCAEEDPTIFLPRQFSNPDNALCHQLTTGAEILAQVQGSIDAFVTGVGTGGTLMGVARALRQAGRNCHVIAVEAAESAVMSGGAPGENGIQGLADGFIPELVCLGEIDHVTPSQLLKPESGHAGWRSTTAYWSGYLPVLILSRPRGSQGGWVPVIL